MTKATKQKTKSEAKENTNAFSSFYFLRKQQNLFEKRKNYQRLQIIKLSKQETPNSLS